MRRSTLVSSASLVSDAVYRNASPSGSIAPGAAIPVRRSHPLRYRFSITVITVV